jgi:hypothetical protein
MSVHVQEHKKRRFLHKFQDVTSPYKKNIHLTIKNCDRLLLDKRRIKLRGQTFNYEKLDETGARLQ